MDKEKEKRTLQEDLSNKLMNVFDGVIEERKKHFTTNDKPSINDIEGIISSASNKNALISGGASLIPGPWGMLAAIPEITLVVSNQIKMIYDIGIAHDKEKVMNKELLASIVLMSMGSGGISLLTMHGSKYLIKRTSLQFFQKMIKKLAGDISQKLIKSTIAKWLPVVGVAAMATWSKYSTKTIGKKATEILSKPIEVENSAIEEKFVETDIIEIDTNGVSLDELKIHSLINLMKIDKNIHEKEIEYINELIANSDFSSDKKQDLKSKIRKKEKIEVDYSIFKDKPDESIGLMIDLVALAKRDGEFHIAEKLLINQIGKQIGLNKDELNELIN